MLSTFMRLVPMHRTTDIRPGYKLFKHTVGSTLLLAAVMGFAEHFGWIWLDGLNAGTSLFVRAVELGAAVIAGKIVYAALPAVLNRDALRRLLRRRC